METEQEIIFSPSDVNRLKENPAWQHIHLGISTRLEMARLALEDHSLDIHRTNVFRGQALELRTLITIIKEITEPGEDQ